MIYIFESSAAKNSKLTDEKPPELLLIIFGLRNFNINRFSKNASEVRGTRTNEKRNVRVVHIVG